MKCQFGNFSPSFNFNKFDMGQTLAGLAGRRGPVGSASDCRAGSRQFKSWHPTSAETCMWGRWLAAMLALYTGKCVTPEVNLREHISRTPPHSSNKAEPTLALKPRGDVTRSPKQGYQWPHKWTCVQHKFKKKKKKKTNKKLLLIFQKLMIFQFP